MEKITERKQKKQSYGALALELGLALLCLALGEQLILRGSLVSSAVKEALRLCVSVLIPSLFCFMVLSSFLSQSGLGRLLSLPLLPLSRLLGIPADCGSVLLLCLVGGYPVGAKALRDAYLGGRLEGKQFQRLCLFAICPAPSFVIIAVGQGLLGSLESGLLLYLSQVLGLLTLALVTRFFTRSTTKASVGLLLSRREKPSYSQALVDSVAFSANALLVLCGNVALFSVLRTLLEQLPWPGESALYLSAGLEVTSAMERLCAYALPHKLSVLAFYLAFGGLAVLFQLKNILGGLPCSLGRLLLGRVLHGLLAALYGALLLPLFPQAVAVFQSVSQPQPLASPSTPILTGCLLGMLLILLGSIQLSPEQK